MYELGALKALLCGSGPTVCGIFADKSGADAARKMLGDGAFCATLGVK
jgi:shikimate kinase